MAKKTFTASANTYFKPAEHERAIAFLIEGKGFREQVPNANPMYEPADHYIANLTVFTTPDELNGKVEPKDLGVVNITNRVLAREGWASFPEGDWGVARLAKGGKQNRVWLWRPVDPAVDEKVSEYYAKREANVSETKAAGLPAFLTGGDAA